VKDGQKCEEEEGTAVTFNHIDEYDDSESENETEETSSSQLSHVLVGLYLSTNLGLLE
jgi:hypothetical protein